MTITGMVALGQHVKSGRLKLLGVAPLKRVSVAPDVKERLATDGAEPVANTPKQFAAHIKAEITRWAPVVEASGAKPD